MDTNHRVVTTNFLMLLLFGFVLTCTEAIAAQGDGVYFKGNGGYGEILANDFQDLSYTQDFSIEAAINIGWDENSSNWMGVATKTGIYGMYNSSYAGWGLSVSQSHQFGSYIYATVSDGTTQNQVSTSEVTGRSHVIVTWLVGTRTLSLYINGQRVMQLSKPALDPNRIANTDPFWIGKSLNVLKSPLLYLRLWNRDLAADVATLYAHYTNTRQHRLPPGFDTTNLKSEWLMDQESDAAGQPGTTHIKDSVGSNHVRMLNGADLVSSGGTLAMVAPVNGVTEQNKAVTLKAAGGFDTLAQFGTVSGPVQYYFQVDESASFNSANLKESGWIANFPSWQPILKPNTTYYWRVRVRDSASIPLISAYTSTQTFTTEGPTTWYVRPASGSLGNKTNVVYGMENGTSYDNAWNGLLNVVWGELGVEAGDTLYVAGLHVFDMPTGWLLVNGGDILVAASGFSDDFPITIRGDHPNDPGVIWGGYTPSWLAWTSVGSGVYKITLVGNHQNDWFFQDVTQNSFITLTRQTSVADVTANSGSFYLDPADYKTLYVQMTDGGNPTGRIVANSWGYEFHLATDKYLVFSNLGWYAHQWTCDPFLGVSERCSHLTWSRMKMGYSNLEGFSFYDNMHYMRVLDSEIMQVPNGIYNHSTTDDAPANYEYRGNTIHDIGTRASGDMHCIGIQGGDNGLIELNELYNCYGSGITFYNFSNHTVGGVRVGQMQRNNTIRYNFVHDIKDLSDDCIIRADCSNERGIELGSDSSPVIPETSTGNIVHHNILSNITRIGFRFKSYKPDSGFTWRILNNVVHKAGVAHEFGVCVVPDNALGRQFIAGQQFTNNIILDSDSLHVDMPSTYNATLCPQFDISGTERANNLYFPDIPNGSGNNRFKWQGTYNNFSQWKSASQLDLTSIVGDPLFVDAGNPNPLLRDFHLTGGSPAINAGADVGLTTDLDGKPIVANPDIGAYELQYADLSLILTDTPDPVLPGDTVTYTITVTNNGPSPVTNVTTSGTLPSCNLGTIASGASAGCTRTATATSVGTLSQSMSVAATEFDPNTANNTASATTAVLGSCTGSSGYKIAGKVKRSDGTAITGVDLTLIRTSTPQCGNRVMTPSNGNYQFTKLANGTYTVTPSKAGCSGFTPNSRPVTISGGNQTNQNFTGACP